MAEERTLGLARAPEQSTEDLSKEELQRRMGEARDSISSTVSEIKETVAHQVQAVKDTLDWREQFKKRPVVWSVGALGVGFLVGFRVADMVAGDDEPRGRDYRDYYDADYRSYAAQPVLSQASPSMQQPSPRRGEGGNGYGEDTGPGFFEKLTNTPAYGRVKDEVGEIGNNLIQEVAKTAKTMIVPAVIASLKKFLGDHLPEGSTRDQEQSSPRSLASPQPTSTTRNQGGYQPALERNSELS